MKNSRVYIYEKKNVEEDILATTRFRDRKVKQPIRTTSSNKELFQQNKEFETILPIYFFTNC